RPGVPRPHGRPHAPDRTHGRRRLVAGSDDGVSDKRARGREGPRCETAPDGRTRGVRFARRACDRGRQRSRWALIGRGQGETMIIDSHCHLHDPAFEDTRGVVTRATEHNVWGVVAVGCDPETNLRTLEAAATNGKAVWPALGFHPERADLTDE